MNNCCLSLLTVEATHIIVSPQPRSYGRHVERVCNEVNNIPEITSIFLQPSILIYLPVTHAKTPYSTTEGKKPLLVVSDGRSQPTISSILREAKISRTEKR